MGVDRVMKELRAWVSNFGNDRLPARKYRLQAANDRIPVCLNFCKYLAIKRLIFLFLFGYGVGDLNGPLLPITGKFFAATPVFCLPLSRFEAEASAILIPSHQIEFPKRPAGQARTRCFRIGNPLVISRNRLMEMVTDHR